MEKLFETILKENSETIFPCEITTYAEESMARSSLDYYETDDEERFWSEYEDISEAVIENSNQLRQALIDLTNYCEDTGSIDLDIDKAVSDLLSTGKTEFLYKSGVNRGEKLKYIIQCDTL